MCIKRVYQHPVCKGDNPKPSYLKECEAKCEIPTSTERVDDLTAMTKPCFGLRSHKDCTYKQKGTHWKCCKCTVVTAYDMTCKNGNGLTCGHNVCKDCT